jgi:hypothetical protein
MRVKLTHASSWRLPVAFVTPTVCTPSAAGGTVKETLRLPL